MEAEVVNAAALELALVLAQQEHSPPAGAHFALLAGLVVAAIAIFGVKWWRGRREAAAADEHSPTHDRSGESTRSTEDE
jgi:hypothetical protein